MTGKKISPTLYIVTPVLECDLIELYSNSDKIRRMLASAGILFKWIVVLQVPGRKPVVDVRLAAFKTCQTEKIGVSYARNVGMEVAISMSRNATQDCIYFLDPRIMVSYDFIAMVACFFESISASRRALCAKLVYGVPPYGSENSSAASGLRRVDPSRVNPFYDYSLSKWCFSLGSVSRVRFREDLGPSPCNVKAAAEDIEFIFRVLIQDPPIQIVKCDACVYRAPRPDDLSVHVKYAYGHGAVLRELLLIDPGRHIGYAMLFLINGMRYAIFSRRNGRKVFILRLSGLLGLKIKRNR